KHNTMQYRQVSFSDGFSWLKQGSQAIAQYPLGWFGLAAIYFLILYSPTAGFFFGVLEPALLAGIYRAGQAQRTKQPWSLKTILSPLAGGSLPILILGLALTLLKLVVLMLGLMHIATVLDLEQLLHAYLQEDWSTVRQIVNAPDVIPNMMLTLSVVFSLMLAISMAGLFSPILVAEHKLAVPVAMVLSLKAAVKNIGALTAYTSIFFIAAFFMAAGLAIVLLPMIAWFIAAYCYCVDDIFPDSEKHPVESNPAVIEV
ncbi:MAG: hypothetical protein D6694_11605, partial [Gammaproteobacteria bacterium]